MRSISPFIAQPSCVHYCLFIVLACARAAAAHLVTGDKDLLALKTYLGIRISATRDFELLFEA
jgi:hypothetical protein